MYKKNNMKNAGEGTMNQTNIEQLAEVYVGNQGFTDELDKDLIGDAFIAGYKAAHWVNEDIINREILIYNNNDMPEIGNILNDLLEKLK